MDISKFPTVKETSTVTIRNPVTQEYMFSVEVYGPDTDHYRRVQVDIVRSSKGKKPDTDDILNSGAKMLAKITKSWKDLTLEGKEFPCGEGNAYMIYTDFKYVADQVDAFISDRLNFLELA